MGYFAVMLLDIVHPTPLRPGVSWVSSRPVDPNIHHESNVDFVLFEVLEEVPHLGLLCVEGQAPCVLLQYSDMAFRFLLWERIAKVWVQVQMGLGSLCHSEIER